jgi:ABC-type bacteriocin/lantibiotic exporter with double-glycine peptidase domain
VCLFAERTFAQVAGRSIVRDCGAFCVAYVCRDLGVSPISVRDARDLVDPDGDGLSSLLDLSQGLASFGVSAIVMRADGKHVPDGTSILHVRSSVGGQQPNHFVVCKRLEDGRVLVYSPPTTAEIGAPPHLLERWGGDYIRIAPNWWRSLWIRLFVLGGAVLVGGLIAFTRSRGNRRGGAMSVSDV